MSKRISQKKLNKYLQTEIEKAESLGLSLLPIRNSVKVKKLKNVFGCCSIINYTCNGRKEVICEIQLSKFATKLPKNEVKSILMHEVLHAVSGSKGHGKVWKENCKKVKETFSYKGYEEFHLHEKPYSKDRLKKAYISKYYQ